MYKVMAPYIWVPYLKYEEHIASLQNYVIVVCEPMSVGYRPYNIHMIFCIKHIKIMCIYHLIQISHEKLIS